MRAAELRLLGLPRHRRRILSRARLRALASLPRRLKVLLYRGERYFCPVCESRVRRFLGFGDLPDECCPVCASMRRHRLLWLYLTRRSDLFGGIRRRVLHFAPEPAIETRLKRVPSLDYVTADLYAPLVMDREDITKMTYPDRSFDVVLCSHVLEHVPEDRAAMYELARVLRPGGYAVIMVPYDTTGDTDEDLSVSDPAERERRFGQFDHVRCYGLDLVDRLAEAGLDVGLLTASSFLSTEELERFQIDGDETIFVCTTGS